MPSTSKFRTLELTRKKSTSTRWPSILVSCGHSEPAGACLRKVGSHGSMNPGTGAGLPPGTAGNEGRLDARFNAAATDAGGEACRLGSGRRY